MSLRGVGPAGSQGPPGPTGPQGSQGAQGDAVAWIVAAGAPGAGTGENGDMYLNSSNGDVYGPKAAGAWGAPVDNITGPQGAQGPQGVQGAQGVQGDAVAWIVAAGAPGAGTGENGDMYLNSSNGDVYGPKAAGAWGASVANIRGPAGTANVIAVRKALDESVVSSTTYQDDNALTFAIAANETWVADFMLIVRGSNAADIKLQFTAPTLASLSCAGIGPATSVTAFDGDATWYGADINGVLGGYAAITSTAGQGTVILARVVVANGANAGNVTLQWAQLASNVTPTVVAAGSSLTAMKVA